MEMCHLVFLSELRHPIVNSLECLRKQDLWLAHNFLTNKALNCGKKQFYFSALTSSVIHGDDNDD